MLHVVDRNNAHLYQPQLEESYRIRHDIYVEGRRWEALRRQDGREIDQFDNEDAIYLLALEGPQRRVTGGSRLVPSLRPHLLSDVFPELASYRSIPRSRLIFEWTRFFVVAERRETHAISVVSCAIMAGIQEFGLRQGLTHFTIVAEAFWLTRFLQLGWNAEALGLPKLIDGSPVIGFTVRVSEEAYQSTLAVRSLEGPVLTWQTPPAVQPVATLRSA